MVTEHNWPPAAERPPTTEAQPAPPLGVQSEFLRVALGQGKELEYKPKVVKGPFLDDFSEVMRHVGQRLQDIHPSLAPDSIMPFAYQSSKTTARLSRLGLDKPHVTKEVGELRYERRRILEEIAKEKIIPSMETQSVPAGLLSVPPFRSQTEGVADCVGACFGMVFEGVVGWAPPQDLLNDQLHEYYKKVRVEDEVFMQIFQTDAFKAMCDKSVSAYELMGADLAQISRLSAKAKQKWPESDVFCTVYQLSKTTSDPHTLHQNVLLSADDGKVVTHDPKEGQSGPFYEQSYEDFASRWAASYNRAHLVIAK